MADTDTLHPEPWSPQPELPGRPPLTRDQLLRIFEVLLAGLGIFVTGTLSLAEILERQAPCGGSDACQMVVNSPFSHMLGLPIAYFGLLAYLLILGFNHRRQPGYAIAAIGTAVSGILLALSISYQTICIWCISSALLMTAIFFVKKFRDDLRWENPSWSVNLGVAVIAITVARFAVDAAPDNLLSMKSLRSMPVERLAPIDAPSRGDAMAPVVIVEFGDFTCPACRDGYKRMRDAMAKYEGIRLVYRYYPSKHHYGAFDISVQAELAHRAGKFWAYADTAMTVSTDAAWKAVDLPNREGELLAEQRVNGDLALGEELGIQLRPVFIIMTPAGLRLPVTNLNLDQALEEKAIKRYLKKR